MHTKEIVCNKYQHVYTKKKGENMTAQKQTRALQMLLQKFGQSSKLPNFEFQFW